MPKVYAIDGIIPVVDPTAFVHPRAVLIGDVTIGAESYVAPGASLRGDFGRIVIGRACSFQDNCIAHIFAREELIIGDHVIIGHGAVLLVGDAPYYARFGFAQAKADALYMPGPFERERFLGLELRADALEGAEGVLRATGAFEVLPEAAAEAAAVAARRHAA